MKRHGSPSIERLGPHHFAHLRAVAEGIAVVDVARLYLPISHAAEAVTMHRLVVDKVRAIARRRGDSRWRLVGIQIGAAEASGATPSIDAWAEAEGLTDWSRVDLQDMYAERLGVLDPKARRRQARNARLRARRLQLLQELEATAATPAQPTDLLEGWLAPDLVEQLRRCGALMLADLQQRLDRGGRWWTGMKGFGPTKAARLVAFTHALLPALRPPHGWSLALAKVDGSRGLARFSGAQRRNRAQVTFAGTDAGDDRQAVQRWVEARATSEHTRKQYIREAERFILWCVIERGKALSDTTAKDCSAYMGFLGDVPSDSVSRRMAERHSPGWAPFRGPLTLASQGRALAALHSLFAWLAQARYLASNLWLLVNRKLGDDPHQLGANDTGSRAFTPAAWAAIGKYLDASVSDALDRACGVDLCVRGGHRAALGRAAARRSWPPAAASRRVGAAGAWQGEAQSHGAGAVQRGQGHGFIPSGQDWRSTRRRRRRRCWRRWSMPSCRSPIARCIRRSRGLCARRSSRCR